MVGHSVKRYLAQNIKSILKLKVRKLCSLNFCVWVFFQLFFTIVRKNKQEFYNQSALGGKKRTNKVQRTSEINSLVNHIFPTKSHDAFSNNAAQMLLGAAIPRWNNFFIGFPWDLSEGVHYKACSLARVTYSVI